MSLPETGLVTILKREVPIALITLALLFKTDLRHHVQFSGGRQFGTRRRLFACFVTESISLALFGCAPVLRPLGEERHGRAGKEDGNRHKSEEPTGLESARHSLWA